MVPRKMELDLDKADRDLSIALLKNGIGHTSDIEGVLEKALRLTVRSILPY
jgi:hypothetical protein